MFFDTARERWGAAPNRIPARTLASKDLRAISRLAAVLSIANNLVLAHKMNRVSSAIIYLLAISALSGARPH